MFTQTPCLPARVQSIQVCWVHLKLLQGALFARGLHKSLHGLPLSVLNTPQLPHSFAYVKTFSLYAWVASYYMAYSMALHSRWYFWPSCLWVGSAEEASSPADPSERAS